MPAAASGGAHPGNQPKNQQARGMGLHSSLTVGQAQNILVDLAACPVWRGWIGFGFRSGFFFVLFSLPSRFDIPGAGAHEHRDTIREKYIA